MNDGPGTPSSPAWARACLVLCVALGAVHALRFVGYVCDDAVISFRSVWHFGRGDGLVYNLGEQVETYTNLGWVLALAAAQALGADLFAAAGWLGWAAACGTLLASWWLARELLSAGAAVVVVLVLAASTTLMGQAGSGLETSAYALLLTVGLGRLLRECRPASADRPPARAGLGMLLLCAAAVVRFDGVLVVVGALCLLVVWLKADRRRAALAIDGAVAAAGLLAPAVFRLAYYGSAVPNPVHAKVGLAPDPAIYRQGLSYVLEWLRTDFGLPVLVGGLLLSLATGRRAQALVVLGGGWLLYLVASGGDHMAYHRFAAPMLPVFAVLVVGGFELVWRRSGLGSSRLGALTAAAVAVALAASPLLASMSRGNVPARNAEVEGYRREIGEFFASRCGAGRLVVAGGAAGYMGYFGGPGVRFVDMLGLTDAHVARHGRKDPQMPPGHQCGDGDYVLAQRPTFVVLGAATPGDRWQRPDAEQALRSIQSQGVREWERANDYHFSVSEREMLAEPAFLRDYQLVRVPLASGRTFQVMQRR